MRHGTYYLLLIFAVLLSMPACVPELPLDEPAPLVEAPFPEGEPVTVTFSLQTDDLTPSTKALSENGELNTLHVAVFGSSGYLREYVKAKFLGEGATLDFTTPDTTTMQVSTRNFSVTLSLSEKPRILHFIGNGPTTLPFDADTTILSDLMSESGGQAFWQVKRVKSIAAKKDAETGLYIKNAEGYYEADQAIQDSLKNIPLIRNWAKISVFADEGSGFTPISFAVVNVPERGTVAPMYRVQGSLGQDSLAFVEKYETKTYKQLEQAGYPGNLPSGVHFVHTVPAKQDFADCTNGVVAYASGAGATYLYERPVPSGQLEATFLIVYGTYAGDGHNYYYRIDLADEEDGYYAVYRNFWYRVDIKQVGSVGHLTPEAAAQSSGGTLISSDVVTSHLGDISDGVARLVVQPWMTQSFPSRQTNNAVLHAKFFADLTADPVLDDDAVTLERLPMSDGGDNVITAYHISAASTGEGTEKGWRTITFSTAEPDASVSRTQTLRITGHYTKNGVPRELYRDVEITLMPLQTMTLSCAQDTVVRGIGRPQTLYITLPDGLLESMFPLTFTIEAESLSLMPKAGSNLPVIAGMSISDSGERKGEKTLYFSWTLSWEDYQAATPVQSADNYDLYLRTFSCDFVTTRSVSATNIWVANEFFHKAKTAFFNKEDQDLPYFYVEAADADGCSVTINQSGLSYQVDNDGWMTYTANTRLFVEEGQKLYFKGGSASEPILAWSGKGKFNGTGNFNIGGNLASLMLGEDYEQGASLTGNWTFSYMFQDETGLCGASDLTLPMATMTASGYRSLFEGCTNLTVAPAVLPATTLATSCYAYMFKSCTKLSTPPALPARTLAESCYEQMFHSCKALTKAPTLRAETLVTKCYNQMFNGCTSLQEIAMMATDVSASNCLANWVNNVPSSGTFYRNPDKNNFSRGVSAVPTNWTLLPWDELRIRVNDPGSVSYSGTGLEYSLNWGDWTDYTAGSAITLATDDNVRFRTSARVVVKCDGSFSASTGFKVSGNVMSLVAGSDYRTATSVPAEAFQGLFLNATNLSSVAGLSLPATTLAKDCYRQMFMNCTQLKEAPELPAETLAAGCYAEMFYGCSQLSQILCDARDISATGCTQDWMSGVADTGLFGGDHYSTAWTKNDPSGIPPGWSASNYFYVKPAADGGYIQVWHTDVYYSLDAMTWTAYTSGSKLNVEKGKPVYFKAGSADSQITAWNSGRKIYTSVSHEMGGNLASLIVGGDFVTLDKGLTGYSFADFSKSNSWLTSAEHLEFPMETCGDSCYKSFFESCSGLVTGPSILPAMQLGPTCYRNMFNGCSSLTAAPVLPATTLASGCYQYMFYNCKSMTYVKMLGAEYVANNFTNWMQNCLSGTNATGCVFVRNASNTGMPRNNSGIPQGWTVIEE